MWQNIKTALLLALMDALFLVIGGLVGHATGLVVAAVIAVVMNAVAYWKSDCIAVRAAHARRGLAAAGPKPAPDRRRTRRCPGPAEAARLHQR